jgi:hypothetical protein
MNECNEECVSLGVCRRKGSFRGREGQATRKSRKQRGKQLYKQQARNFRKPQRYCKPQRYLRETILDEEEDELLAEMLDEEEDELLAEIERRRQCSDNNDGTDKGAEFYGPAEYYGRNGGGWPIVGEQERYWYNQNILSNPRRMFLVRQLQYAAECRHTLALCSMLSAQGRASATDTPMAILVSLALPTYIQQQIISMVHTEPPRISTPFVPGIYMYEDFGCPDCRGPFAQALVVFPGMKTARWVLLSPGCEPQNESSTLKKGHYTCKRLFERVFNHSWPDAALLEDYELLVDYALDPSLDTYEARINGNEIVVDQRPVDGIVGTAVHRSELSPEDLAYNGIFNEDHSDWLIKYGGCCLHLRVRL